MSNTFDKLSVLDSFIEEVNSYLPEIETNLERLTQSSADMDALEEIYRRTHTIGGSASMMDFPGLAHVAHGMEDILGDALDGLITLDEPPLGLLKRSLGRLHQLLEGIRSGIDEEAVIAEDDADYARYRALIDNPSSPAAQVSDETYSENNNYTQAAPSLPSFPQSFEIPASFSAPPPSIPSFDEVLASFRTPSVTPGEDMGWPEEAALVSRFDEAVSPISTDSDYPEVQYPKVSLPEPQAPPSSALDALVASTRRPTPLPLPPQQTPVPPLPDYPPVPAEMPAVAEPSPFPEISNSYLDLFPPIQDQPQSVPGVSKNDKHIAVREESLPQAYDSMQRDTASLAAQASSLHNVIAQLHDAMTVIEAQRGEFKGFLNGSKDALDRMEDWAGKAMGLNLRNSPEQVRRYLPLSVMWVSNSKLKKVFDLLRNITEDVELTDEQMSTAFQQLQVSIRSCGETFQQLQAQSSQNPAQTQHTPSWSPWEMQYEQNSDALRERVTFERQGDLAALRAEIESHVREELRQERDSLYQEREELRREYENRQVSVPPLVLAELEQKIRGELRREYEERQRLQERIIGSGTRDESALQELEARLRGEVEIQVRQEFLSQIMNAGGDPSLLAARLAPDHNPSASTPGSSAKSNSIVTNIPGSATGNSGSQRDARPTLPPVQPMVSSTPTASKGSATNIEFDEEAVEVFRLEAEELLQTISMHVAALEKNPTNRDLIQGVRRATHTLKGAAGMMGLRTISDLAHVSEDLLDLIMEGAVSISSTVVSLILDTAEALDLLIMGNDYASGEAKSRQLHTRYADFLGDRASAVQMSEIDLEPDVDDEDQDADVAHFSSVVADNSNDPLATKGGRGNLSVHVRLQKIDELVNLFGEMLVSRSVLEERIQRLVRLVTDVAVSSNRLADVGQRLESRFEAATLPSGRSVQAMPGEGDQSLAVRGGGFNSSVQNGKNNNVPAHLSEFDELELDRYTEFHQLARGLSEGISDMATLSTEMDAVIRECEGVFARESRLSTTFQDRLMKVRLVPLSTMTPRLYRAARAVALKQGKEVDFVLEGETTEVDRTVYEEIFGPLLHLVRNAVNHAIEIPAIRTQRGKSKAGIVKLAAGYDGNQIVISVRDDGSGLDRESIRQTAIARGFISANQQLGEDEIVSLIFRPGFSTAEKLSEESGRGVGLDVVRDSVSRLRGNLVVETTPGQGTTFTMSFPTSLAIQSAMMVRTGGQQFAIPTANVESIGRLDNFKRVSSGGQPAVVVRNEPYPLHMLAQYLSLPLPNMLDDKAQILLVNASGHRVALVVDEIRGKSDIVMKNLGPHLREVDGIAGGTVLGNGQVVLVLELNALLSSNIHAHSFMPVRRDIPVAGQVRQRVDISANNQNAPARPTTPAASTPEGGKHLLVVDDSPSVRRVVSNMLKQHGWTVQMARDGVEALEMISLETPAAVLLDIEMPRMDGYELISTVRAQEQYRTLPLIVLTSRAAAKHQQRAISLGASAYVVKPYQDEELLNTINSLVFGGAVSR